MEQLTDSKPMAKHFKRRLVALCSSAVFCAMWIIIPAAKAQYPVSYQLPLSISADKAGTDFCIATVFNVAAPWYIYAPTGNNAAQGMLETTIIFQLPKGFSRKGGMALPATHFKGGFEIFDGDSIAMSQEFIVAADVLPGEYTIHAKISFQCCNEKTCLPPKTEEREIRVMVGGGTGSGRPLIPEKQKSMQLSFTALDGRKVDLSALKGKLVLIDCWATWCRPCIAEFDHLKKLYDKYHKQGFEVIGVSADVASAKDRVLKLVKEHGLPWPQRFEGGGFDKDAFLLASEVQSLPTVFLIDKAGNVVDRDARGERLEELIKKYLK